MKPLAAFLATFAAIAAQLFIGISAANAQDTTAVQTIRTISWVEEWDPTSQSWIRVEGNDNSFPTPATSSPVIEKAVSHSIAGAIITTRTYKAARYSAPAPRPISPQPIAQYGPFKVIDSNRVAIIGSTNSATPHHFDAMMRDFPLLTTLEMIEAPGTTNDIANLAVGRRIRAAGLATYVPSGGSVRSGAVELFLAGTTRRIAPDAQFAVHAWLDNYGREPDDFAPNSSANMLYLNYYEEMGMSKARARAFYDMTNSVPHRSAKWLRAEEMQHWIAPESKPHIVLTQQIALADPVQLPMAAINLVQLDMPANIAYNDITSMTLTSRSPDTGHAFLDS